MRLKRKPNLLRRFLYLSETILKRLINPMACSLETRLLEIARFSRFCSFESFSPFGFLCGNTEFLCCFSIPTYPVSVSATTCSGICVSDSVKSLKSCFFPFENITQITFRVFLHTIICVFIVCRFFFPEYHLFCSFFRFFIPFLFRCLFFLAVLLVFRSRLFVLPHTHSPLLSTLFSPVIEMSHLLLIHFLPI